jgi:hypothetical protein
MPVVNLAQLLLRTRYRSSERYLHTPSSELFVDLTPDAPYHL